MGKLVCVDPKSTIEVEIEGAKFKIGVLAMGVQERMALVQKGRPFESVSLAVRYGVKGHEGIEYEDGRPVPFKTEKDADGIEVVSQETMDVYYQALGEKFGALANHAMERSLSPKAKAALAAERDPKTASDGSSAGSAEKS